MHEAHSQRDLLDHIGEPFQVDEKLAPVIKRCFELDLPTTASCQNYGEYLRTLPDMDHVWDSKRDYGYIQFEKLTQALQFLDVLKSRLEAISPLFMRLIQPGTPDAWEVRCVLDWEVFWVMFPESDIPEIVTNLA